VGGKRGKTFASAYREIRELLQRSPHLTAKEIWDELTCWPIPSIRSIHRVCQELKPHLAIDGKLAASAGICEPPSAKLARPDRFLPKEFHVADADKLDRISEHLDSIHEKIDSFGSRIDAIEKTHAEWKAHADAEAEEKEAKEKAAAAAAAAKRSDTSDDPNAFAAAQMKADAAFQAWGKRAPHSLHGEGLKDFRVRLLRDLQPHSKTYRDSDLGTIGDARALEIIETVIINDAISASSAPGEAGLPLRKVVSQNEAGHRVVRFHGDPAVTWAQFMGGSTRWGKLNRLPRSN
jgi:hypothetical protein